MINPTYTLETKFLKTHRFIAGVDEVGRAPLAGPVVAGVVIFDPGKVGKYRSKTKWWIDVRDSKTLSSKKREALVDFIHENALDFGIGLASHREIDDLNIHYASLLAMKRAVENLKLIPEVLLIDGKFEILPFDSRLRRSFSGQVAQGTIVQRTIVDGDAKIFSISAASILAKVFRDDLMQKFSQDFSNYGFERHKGYDTQFHRNKLMTHGPCAIHRMSFSTVREIMNKRWKKML